MVLINTYLDDVCNQLSTSSQSFDIDFHHKTEENPAHRNYNVNNCPKGDFFLGTPPRGTNYVTAQIRCHSRSGVLYVFFRILGSESSF